MCHMCHTLAYMKHVCAAALLDKLDFDWLANALISSHKCRYTTVDGVMGKTNLKQKPFEE